MDSGIYSIRNTVNNKIYIGSAINFKTRFSRHKSQLKLNKHFNKHLQTTYNKYGKENFIFEIIEYCEKDKLIEREQNWIDFFNPEYNKLKIAGNSIGYKHNEETKQIIREKRKLQTFSEETRNKLSIQGKLRKNSDETRLKISLTKTGKKRSKETLDKIAATRLQNKNKNNN